MFESTIDADMLRACRETGYRAEGGEPFALRVGGFSTVLAALHDRHRVDCSAFVMPCNPLGRLLDAACSTPPATTRCTAPSATNCDGEVSRSS